MMHYLRYFFMHFPLYVCRVMPKLRTDGYLLIPYMTAP